MPIQGKSLKHKNALSIGLGMHKGIPIALVYQVEEDDGARPIGTGNVILTEDETNYYLGVTQEFYASWIPEDARATNIITADSGATITLWVVPKLFASGIIDTSREVTMKDIGMVVMALIQKPVPISPSGTITSTQEFKKPSVNNVSVALTKVEG